MEEEKLSLFEELVLNFIFLNIYMFWKWEWHFEILTSVPVSLRSFIGNQSPGPSYPPASFLKQPHGFLQYFLVKFNQ